MKFQFGQRKTWTTVTAQMMTCEQRNIQPRIQWIVSMEAGVAWKCGVSNHYSSFPASVVLCISHTDEGLHTQKGLNTVKSNFQAVASSYSPGHVVLYANGRKLNQKLDGIKPWEELWSWRDFPFLCLFAHNSLSCEISPAMKYLNYVISFSQRDKRM